MSFAQEDENESEGEVVEVVEEDDSNSNEEQPLYRAERAIRDHGRGIGNCRSNRDCRRGQECKYVGRSLIRNCQSSRRF